MSSFVPVAIADQIPAGTATRVLVDGIAIAIVHAEDGFHAIADRCSHADVSLAEGEVDGCTIECWLHGSAFDLRTGKPLSPPAVVPVRVFPLRVSDTGEIEVDITTPAEGTS